VTSATLSIFRAHEWDRNAIHTYFQAKAASAEAYLSELRAKLSARPAYEPIYDETLASYYVHNYFHGRTWLASRHFASITSDPYWKRHPLSHDALSMEDTHIELGLYASPDTEQQIFDRKRRR